MTNARQVFQNTVVVIATFVAAYVLYMGMRILIDLLMAILIASAIRPLVMRLISYKFPPAFAIVLVYSILFGIVAVATLIIIPPFVEDGVYYIENDNKLADRIFKAQTRFENSVEDFTNRNINLLSESQVQDLSNQMTTRFQKSLPNVLNDFTSTLGEILLIVVMGAYWLTARDRAIDFLGQLFSPQYRIKVENIINDIEYSLGGYMRGVVGVGFIIGTLNAIFMGLAGVPSAPVLGLIIGITTMIPMIGGILGGVLAVLVTLIISPDHIVVVAAIAFLMQLAEGYIVSPALMSRTVNINPLMLIVYTLIGFALFGIVGALIAVPVMRSIHILINYLIIDPHKSNIRLFRIEKGLIIMNPPAEIPEESPIEVATK